MTGKDGAASSVYDRLRGLVRSLEKAFADIRKAFDQTGDRLDRHRSYLNGLDLSRDYCAAAKGNYPV